MPRKPAPKATRRSLRNCPCATRPNHHGGYHAPGDPLGYRRNSARFYVGEDDRCSRKWTVIDSQASGSGIVERHATRAEAQQSADDENATVARKRAAPRSYAPNRRSRPNRDESAPMDWTSRQTGAQYKFVRTTNGWHAKVWWADAWRNVSDKGATMWKRLVASPVVLSRGEALAATHEFDRLFAHEAEYRHNGRRAARGRAARVPVKCASAYCYSVPTEVLAGGVHVCERCADEVRREEWRDRNLTQRDD